jgi:PKD repeat protein
MKKIYAAIVTSIFSIVLSAQTFTSTTQALILDNTWCSIPITVSGLPTSMDTAFGLCTVCVNLTHTWDSDLDLFLVTPNGDSIALSNNHGGSGDNYTGTCFNMSATNSIITGTPPFTGMFLPEMSLNNLNNLTNPNGVWHFNVKDEAPNDTGHIIDCSITFCANPPADPPSFAGPCAVNNGAGCQCPDGTQDCDLLPDMIASADIIANQHTETPGMITLSNATPNIGWGPMEIHGSNNCWCDTVSVPCSTTLCPNNQPPTQQLIQRIYHKNGNTITYRDTLTPGTMSYHPTHGHIHVNNWAEFTLRTQDTTQASPLNWPIIATGSKVSFCLINLGDCTGDYGYCHDTLGNIITMADIPNAPFGLVSGCGLDQGIYTGNLDIYSQSLPDMYIDLTNVCNGNYFIVSQTDPDNNFIETNDNNNYVVVPITLTQQHIPITSSFNVSSISFLSATFSNNNTDLTSFIWDFGDGNTDTIQNPVIHTYATPGTYTVTLTQTNACGTYTTSQVITITGIDQVGNFSSQLLKAYPNPSNGSTTVSYQMPESGEMQLEIFNLLGERIAVLENGKQAEGWHDVKIDFAAMGLDANCYFIRLTTQNHLSTMRIVNTK